MSRIPLDTVDDYGADGGEPAGPCECCGEWVTTRVSMTLDDGVFCCLRAMCKEWCFSILHRGE